VKWQGWLYAFGWSGAIGLPFLLLIGRHQPAEALIWIVLIGGGLAVDVGQILRGIRGPQGGERAALSDSSEIIFIQN
jgi:hypothetical protein